MPDTRFRSAYNLRQLVDVVVDVAGKRGADVEPAARRLTQRHFDALRVDAGHPEAPSARQICARLGIGWDAVLELALERDDADRSIGVLEGVDRDEDLSLEVVVEALALIAGRLGQASLIPLEYRAECERLQGEQARRHRHGQQIELPTIGQIEHLLGWDRALALAGLEPRAPRPRRLGTPLAEALDRVIDLYGALPTKPELACAAMAVGISLAREPWRPAIEDLRIRRRRAGKWTPPRPPRPDERPDYDVLPPGFDGPLDLGEGARRRAPRAHTVEVVEEAMRAFLSELPSKEAPTQQRYLAYCRRHPGTPWPSSFAQFGGWGAVRDRILSGS